MMYSHLTATHSLTLIPIPDIRLHLSLRWSEFCKQYNTRISDFEEFSEWIALELFDSVLRKTCTSRLQGRYRHDVWKLALSDFTYLEDYIQKRLLYFKFKPHPSSYIKAMMSGEVLIISTGEVCVSEF